MLKPWSHYGNYAELEELIGQTFSTVTGTTHDGSDAVHFVGDNVEYMLYHHQNCCESVALEEVIGDLDDLAGSPITMAEVVTEQSDTKYGSETWSFYKFATVKGYVTLRWLGSSNGYYSEEVDFIKREPYKMTYPDLHDRMELNFAKLGGRSPTVYIVTEEEYDDLCDYMRAHHGLPDYNNPAHIAINYEAGQLIVVEEAFTQRYEPVQKETLDGSTSHD